MAKMTIDVALCNQCGRCVLTCPAAIFHQPDKGVVPKTRHEVFCIACGHCVAICPVAAVRHEDFPEGRVHPIDVTQLPSFEQMLELFRLRRSIRAFKDEPVEKELIERILDAARLAPSAHNLQSTHVVVVQNPATLGKTRDLTARYFTKLCRQLRNPVTRTLLRLIAPKEIDGAVKFLPELDLLLAAVRQGQDAILRGASCLLLFHADAHIGFADVNANLALHNATLACQALGLGSFYTGFVLAACKRDHSIPKLLGVPDNHRVFAGMALGHPRFTYTNWPERKPLPARWI